MLLVAVLKSRGVVSGCHMKADLTPLSPMQYTSKTRIDIK